MLLADLFCILFAIGEKIIPGTGDLLSRIVGEFLGMCLIPGIWLMLDVHGKNSGLNVHRL
jgi:hypothetical protein